ncbi:MAG TPA: hypothetical protein VMF53_00885 [Alphaproteobacteria bacterium]|nr:hypothetical protein [Alphaproteobacteria bacterium]
MVKRVYFHIDEVARDSVVAANLKRVLAARGIELVYGNRPSSRFLPRVCPFDALVLPTVQFVQAVAPDPTAPMPPMIVLPTEGIGGIPEDPKRAALKFLGDPFMAGDRRWVEKVAAFCLWGKQQLIGFEQFAPHLADRCHVIGHPRFDRRCLPRPRPRAASGDGTVRIGLLTRYSMLNPFDGRTALTYVHSARRSKFHHIQLQPDPTLDIEDLYFTNVSDLRVTFDLIDRLDPQRHRVALRIHPREDRTHWEALAAAQRLPISIAPWDQPFIHWLEEVDWMVAPPSTSFYDAFVMGKPVVCIDRIAPKRKAHVLPLSDDSSRIIDYTFRPKSLDELMALIARPPAGPVELSAPVATLLANDAHYPECGRSLDALADVCELVMRAHPVEQRASESLRYGLLTAVDGLRQRRMVDQGAWFRLDRGRRRWIDGLAAV